MPGFGFEIGSTRLRKGSIKLVNLVGILEMIFESIFELLKLDLCFKIGKPGLMWRGPLILNVVRNSNMGAVTGLIEPGQFQHWKLIRI